MSFINRFLRTVAPGLYLVLVNGEEIGTVAAATVAEAKAAAEAMCEAAEARLDDFFFAITAWDEPELGCTHTVTIAMRGSGRVVETFTTDDPYGAVEAAREAQAIPFEERMAMYAERGW